MKPFRFIHAADLHLDSSFKGISDIDSEISKELSEATFNTYKKIIDLCIDKDIGTPRASPMHMPNSPPRT